MVVDVNVDNWPENISKMGNICQNSVYYDHKLRTGVKDVDNWPENISKMGNICENSV